MLETAIGIVAHPPLATGSPGVVGYEIMCRLGAGAPGEVWLAEELNPERTVALKILHGDSSAGSSTEILRREIRILAKLRHPNLVLLHHGVLTTDGRQGLPMEWIDGWPLDEWLRDHPDLTLPEKLALVRGFGANTTSASFPADFRFFARNTKGIAVSSFHGNLAIASANSTIPSRRPQKFPAHSTLSDADSESL